MVRARTCARAHVFSLPHKTSLRHAVTAQIRGVQVSARVIHFSASYKSAYAPKFRAHRRAKRRIILRRRIEGPMPRCPRRNSSYGLRECRENKPEIRAEINVRTDKSLNSSEHSTSIENDFKHAHNFREHEF